MAARAVNVRPNVSLPKAQLSKRYFFDWLGRQFQVRKLDDWYKISVKQLKDVGAARHLKPYNNSLFVALSTVYPEHGWYAWKFGTVPRGFWDNFDNHKMFFDWLGQQLGIKQLDDWYTITSIQVRESLLGGNGLLYQHYSNSMYNALSKVYPEHDWQGWRFHNLPKGYLQDENKASKVLRHVADQLHITNLEDWYRVSLVQLQSVGASFLVGKLPSLLKEQYPDFPWQVEKFASKNKKATQRWLCIAIKQLFPEYKVEEDYSHPDLKYLGTNRMMQIDVYIPDLKLAFEYQGEQHYYDVYSFAPQNQYSIHDNEKKKACNTYGITYTEVPFWWDRTKESVASTLLRIRPELPLQQYRDFIPIPENFPSTTSHNLSTSNNLMQALNYQQDKDVTGWYASEKYDGIRALWDGKKLVMRKGQDVNVPASFISQLPKDVTLDGELWIGRNKHKELTNTISKAGNWDEVKFMIFDAPESNLPYEERMKLIQKTVSQSRNIEIVKNQVIQSKQHLKELFDSIIKEGGEGIVLRQPGSMYERARSPSMLKMKPLKDTEVTFVKPHSRGGLVCKQSDGQQCIVRCNLEVQQNPPAVGSIITVKHFGNFVSGKLKHPFFVRERVD